MDRDQQRLEALKLAVSRTPDFHEGMERAEHYFKFITKDEAEKTPTTPSPGAGVTEGKDLKRPAKG